VELADCRDARVQHLPEHRARVCGVARPVPALRGVEHLAAPFPEVATARFGSSAQRFLENVAVHVGEAGEREALQLHRVVRRLHALGHREDAAVLDLDQHVGGDMAQPCLLRVPES